MGVLDPPDVPDPEPPPEPEPPPDPEPVPEPDPVPADGLLDIEPPEQAQERRMQLRTEISARH